MSYYSTHARRGATVSLGLAAVALMLALQACSSGGSKTAAGATDADHTRWPNGGDYSYDFVDNGCDTGSQDFDGQANYCVGLMNYTLNHGCAESERQSQYKTDCGDDFHDTNAPAAPNPIVIEPGPVTSPSPTPVVVQPTPPLPQVIQDLLAAGIAVAVSDGAIQDPSQAPFSQRLDNFYLVLAQEESAIIAHKANIQLVFLSSYASYDSATKQATLTVDFTANELDRYLKLIDDHAALEAATGVSLRLGIDAYYTGSGDILGAARALLDQLRNDAALLSASHHVVHGLSLDSSTTYTVYTQTLTVNNQGNSIGSDIENALRALGPSDSLFAWAEQKKIKLTGEFFDSTEFSSFAERTTTLARSERDFEALADAGILKSITLKRNQPVPFFESSVGELDLRGMDEEAWPIGGSIAALAAQYSIAASLAIPITTDMSMMGLDANYATTITLLQSHLPQIRAKLRGIKSISLGQTSAYYAGSDMLVIGYADSAAVLEQTLNSIH